MGYMLSSLAELPVEPDVNLYIFVINSDWQGGANELLERNFARIAQEIGTNAIIAKGFDNKRWNDEVAKKYLGQDHLEMAYLLPALFITDAHPENLNEQSMRLLVPLSKIDEKFGGSDTFFTLLTRFARDGNHEFLDMFQRKEENAVAAGASMIELKPNICGVGININEMISRVLKWQDKKRASPPHQTF